MNSKILLRCLLCAAVFVGVVSVPVYSAPTEFVINGNFEGAMNPPVLSDPPPGLGLDVSLDTIPVGWTIYETFMGGGSETTQATNAATNGISATGVTAMSFARSGGGASGDWTAIEQNLNIDVASYPILTLSVDVILEAFIAHNLEAGGTSPRPSFEWPAVVEIEYDAKSPWDTTVHTFGGAVGNPWIWRFGWYLDPPNGPGDSSSGQGQINDLGDQPLITFFNDLAVIPNVWTNTTFNLHAELPQAETITKITVGGSGWNYSSIIDNVSIVGDVPEPGTMSLLIIGGVALIRRKRK